MRIELPVNDQIRRYYFLAKFAAQYKQDKKRGWKYCHLFQNARRAFWRACEKQLKQELPETIFAFLKDCKGYNYTVNSGGILEGTRDPKRFVKLNMRSRYARNMVLVVYKIKG